MTARTTAADWTPVAFDVLSAARRRYLLAVLLDRDEPTPMSLRKLATDVAARERGHPIVADEHCRRALVHLVHADVPKLVEAGVLNRTDGENAGGTPSGGAADGVVLADHPMLEAEWVRRLLEHPAGSVCDEQLLDRTLETLRPARRRTVLEVLATQCDRIPVHDLATMVVAREEDARLAEVSESASTALATALVHRELPALASAGLVEFDSETVAVDPDAPQFEADWLASSPIGPAIELIRRTRPRDADPVSAEYVAGASVSERGECWTIEGSRNIIERGHQLADEAQSELFVTVSDVGFVQTRCLDRWSAAVDRGVDVYVGSQSPRVRELIGSANPDITVCEPRFDWVNLPIERIDPGRVVFADREDVMLVAVDRSASDEPRATAITGSGPKNALVRLIRGHLGPRLDRLAAVSEHADLDEAALPLPM